MADLDFCRHGFPRDSCPLCVVEGHMDSVVRDMLRYESTIRDLAAAADNPLRAYLQREEENRAALQAAGQTMSEVVERFHEALASDLEAIRQDLPDPEEHSVRELRWEPPVIEPASDLDERLDRLEQKLNYVILLLMKRESAPDEEN